MHERLVKAADEKAAKKAADFSPAIMRQIEKAVLLQTLDHLWREHLVTLEHLRQVIGLRGYGQRDPLNEYKSESFTLFEHMLARLREAVTGQLMHVELARQEDVPPLDQPELPPMEAHHFDPTTGEDEFALEPAGAGNGRGGTRPERAQSRRCRESRRPHHVGQGAAERALPVRLGQEIQALPRRVRLAPAQINQQTSSWPGLSRLVDARHFGRA